MKIRDILHLVLILPLLAGVGFMFTLFSKSTADTSISDATAAWNKIFDAFPAETPGEFTDFEYDETSPEDVAAATQSNAFMMSCAVLMFLGIFGVALATAGKTTAEPVWNPILRIGAVTGLTVGGVWLFGFNLAYPGDFNGFISPIVFGIGGDDEFGGMIEYGMGGMTMWTDALYFIGYVAFFAATATALTAGRQSAISSLVVVLPVTLFVVPWMVSWKWGGGWLDMNLAFYDFAGAGLFHWHVGAVALATGIMMRLFRRDESARELPLRHPRLALWIPGMLLYFLLVVFGMNAGSVLSADVAVVAPVIQVSLAASAVSALIATAIGFYLKGRTLYEWFAHGALAGAVVVSGATDFFTIGQAIGLGVAAGLLIPGAIYYLDRFASIDPLAIGAVHGIGGAIGILAPGFLGLEESSHSGQLIGFFLIPLCAISITVVVGVICGFSRILFFDLPFSKQHGPPPQSDDVWGPEN